MEVLVSRAVRDDRLTVRRPSVHSAQPEDIYSSLSRLDAARAIARAAHFPLLFAFACFFLLGAWVGRATVVFESRARRRHLNDVVAKIVDGVVAGAAVKAVEVGPIVDGVLAGSRGGRAVGEEEEEEEEEEPSTRARTMVGEGQRERVLVPRDACTRCPGLPDWFRVKAEGEVYYWNKRTQVTTFDAPTPER